jgi:hypothetical protein
MISTCHRRVSRNLLIAVSSIIFNVIAHLEFASWKILGLAVIIAAVVI